MSPWERYPKPKTEVIYAPSVPPNRSLILISPQRKLLWPLWVGGALPYPEVARSPGRAKMAPMTLREGSNPCKAPAVDSWRETQRVMALGKCSLIPSTKVPYYAEKGCLLEYPIPYRNVTKWTHPDIQKLRRLFPGTGCRSHTFLLQTEPTWLYGNAQQKAVSAKIAQATRIWNLATSSEKLKFDI